MNRPPLPALFRALLVLITASSFALPTAHSSADDIDTAWGEGKRYFLGVEADAAGRDVISAEGFDIAGHDLAADWVEVITGERGLARLVELGFRFTILKVQDGPQPLYPQDEPETDAPLSDQRYTDPAEMEAFLQQVAADHPQITRLTSLGLSLEGRDIWGIMISDNADVDEDELAVLFSGAHHAREVMTPEVVRDMVDQLTDGYGIDPEITDMVDTYEIWLVPIVNPDGLNVVFTADQNWRKNTRDNNNNGARDSGDGVDLNRNYEWGWGNQCGGSSSNQASATYRGPREGSEPEQQAMAALGRKVRPLFDVEYHAYGEDVFYALSCDPRYSPKLSTIPSSPDQNISRVIAEDYASRIVQADGGVGYGAASYGSRVDGTGRDQQYYENGTIAFVTEVNNIAEGGFRPDYGVYRDATVEGQRPGWKWLIQRISGPAVGGHVVDAVSGEAVEATITLDEMTLPAGQRITSEPGTGRFHLIVVPGDYVVRADAPGYEQGVATLTVGSVFVPTTIEVVPLGSTRLVEENFEDPARAALWTAGFPGDTATDGFWVWGEPYGTQEGTVQTSLRWGNPRFDATPGEAVSAFVTGNQPGAGIKTDDVDGGVTTLISPSYDLSGWYGVTVSWQQWFKQESLDPLDTLSVEVSVDGGNAWETLQTLNTTTGTNEDEPRWAAASATLDTVVPVGADTRFRFRAEDSGNDHLVEAGIDEFSIDGFSLAVQGRVRGVLLSDPVDTVLTWDPVPGGNGAVYDVVRGDLSALSGNAAGVNLGPLLCIENDSSDTDTIGNPDSDTPVAGDGFFYLVRFEMGFSLGDYGTGSAGGTRDGTGGCSP